MDNKEKKKNETQIERKKKNQRILPFYPINRLWKKEKFMSVNIYIYMEIGDTIDVGHSKLYNTKTRVSRVSLKETLKKKFSDQ